jgi:serine/threonine protein kinase
LLDEETIRTIAAMLVQVIEIFHKKDIAIGQLNPSQVKFDESGVMYIDLMWCLFIQMQDFNMEQIDVLDAQYMGKLVIKPAPELSQKNKKIPASDWWTLGIIMYFACYIAMS